MKAIFKPHLAPPALFTICLGLSGAGILSVQADTWDAGGDGISWEDPLNWNTDLAPNAVANTTSDIDGAFTVDRDVVSNPGRTSVQGGAVLNVSGGVTHADGQAGNTVRNFIGNGSTGTVNIFGAGTVYDVGHLLAIAHTNNGVGTVIVSDGATYVGGRGSNTLVGGYGDPFTRGHTLSIGGNLANTGMTGLFEISDASMRTRTGVAVANNGTFSVVGSGGSILLGGANQDAGWFLVSADGTWKAAVDLGGITPIFVEEQDNASTNNPTAEFQAGAMLDVSFVSTPISGTWTVLEVENADIVDGGLAFAPGVDPAVWSFNIDNSGANGIMTVTAVTSTPALTWNGNASGDWDLGATSNWLSGGATATYIEPGEVTFDDTLTGTSMVNLTTTFSPLTLTVSNASTDYSFNGPGNISGVTGLTKNGAGVLTLNNTGGNDFTGPVQLNAGTTTLANADALGATSSVLNIDGGTLDLGGLSVTKGAVNIASGMLDNGTLTGSAFTADAATVNAVLAGANATLTKNGSGTLLLASANTYDGITTVSSGTVQLGSANALGSLVGATGFSTASTLDLNGQTIAETFTQIDGLFINSNTTTAAEITTEIVDAGNLTVDGPGDITLPNIRRTNGVTRRTTKNGAGTLTLGGDVSNNRYGLTVNEGDVILAKVAGEAVSRFPLILNNAASTVTLTSVDEQIGNQTDVNGLHQINEGTLDLNGFNETIAALSTSTGAESGGIVTNSAAGVTSSLTLSGIATTPTATFPGTISGDLNLVKSGLNTQILTGTNTYTGATTVTAGCLVIGEATSIPANGIDVVVNPDAGFGFAPAGLSDTEMETIIGNVTWQPASELIFSVSAPDLQAVNADLSDFTGSTIVLKGNGLVNLNGATLPAGVTFETPDGGIIIGAPATGTDIVIDSIGVDDGSVSGNMVTLSFSASGNVDVYASDSLESGTWSLVASGITNSPATVENNISSTKRFYVLVTAGSGNPFP